MPVTFHPTARYAAPAIISKPKPPIARHPSQPAKHQPFLQKEQARFSGSSSEGWQIGLRLKTAGKNILNYFKPRFTSGVVLDIAIGTGLGALLGGLTIPFAILSIMCISLIIQAMAGLGLQDLTKQRAA